MSTSHCYKCVNCGNPASSLYRQYGPTVLKLSKCNKCNGTVDKYVEYDPVIVMIDLVLMSREAQIHVIYNEEFKSYWKFIIFFLMLETYGIWCNDSLFNITVNALCGEPTNNQTLNNFSLPLTFHDFNIWSSECKSWVQHANNDDSDLFIWEKDFFIQFISMSLGLSLLIITIHMLMKTFTLAPLYSEVTLTRLLKSFALSNVSLLFTLPMLVWGSAEILASTVHYSLVLAYSFVVFCSIFTVLYGSPLLFTIVTLFIGYAVKWTAMFHLTPFIRSLL